MIDFFAESSQGFGLGDRPAQLGGRTGVQWKLHHRQPQRVSRAKVRDQPIRFVAEVVQQHGFQVLDANPAAFQLLAVAVLGQIRMTSENPRTRFDARIKRQVLKRMQRVVMHKDRNRSLRRQQMRRVFDGVPQLNGHLVRLEGTRIWQFSDRCHKFTSGSTMQSRRHWRMLRVRMRSESHVKSQRASFRDRRRSRNTSAGIEGDRVSAMEIGAESCGDSKTVRIAKQEAPGERAAHGWLI